MRLTRVFVVHMKELCIIGYSEYAQWRFWLNAQMLRLVWIFAGRTCPKIQFFTLRFISIWNFICHRPSWRSKQEKGSYTICGQCRSRSACAYAQADLNLHCPLTEWMDTEVYVDEQKMPKIYCADVHAELDLRRPQIVCEQNVLRPAFSLS